MQTKHFPFWRKSLAQISSWERQSASSNYEVRVYLQIFFHFFANMVAKQMQFKMQNLRDK